MRSQAARGSPGVLPVLFDRHPELRSLFARTDMRAQYEKFALMVDEIVQLRTEPRQFVRSAVLLGQRHAMYGVTRDQYGPAGAALARGARYGARAGVHAGGARGMDGRLPAHELHHVQGGGAYAGTAGGLIISRTITTSVSLPETPAR